MIINQDRVFAYIWTDRLKPDSILCVLPYKVTLCTEPWYTQDRMAIFYNKIRNNL